MQDHAQQDTGSRVGGLEEQLTHPLTLAVCLLSLCALLQHHVDPSPWLCGESCVSQILCLYANSCPLSLLLAFVSCVVWFKQYYALMCKPNSPGAHNDHGTLRAREGTCTCF